MEHGTRVKKERPAMGDRSSPAVPIFREPIDGNE